jgi:thiosulfate dehydrogenase [quinone] large subunit
MMFATTGTVVPAGGWWLVAGGVLLAAIGNWQADHGENRHQPLAASHRPSWELLMDRMKTVVMTRERTWALTAIGVALFILLCWIFEDGLLAPPLWNAEEWIASPLITYLLILAIILAGWYQARGIPEGGVPLRVETTPLTAGQVNDPVEWRLLMGNVYFALFWLPMRFFLGRDWLTHGAEKINDPAWVGGGEALRGFWERAVVIPEQGRPPITYDWFRELLQHGLDNGWYTWFAPLVAWGEFLVGLGLIVGGLVGLAAFFGTFMNFSYLLAGTTSTNPVLFGLGIFLVLAWKVAGFWGLDRWLLPLLGTPWERARSQVDAVSAVAEQEVTGVRRPGLP